MRPPVNPGRVTWGGDHLLLALRTPGATEDTAYASLYRTVYSPAGAGFSLLVLAGDVRAIYTDNAELTAWARVNLARRPGHPFRDMSLPVHPARFDTEGATGQTLRHVVHAGGQTIELTWADFETPFYLEAPQGVIGADYDIFSLICSARTGGIVIDGRPLDGDTYANPTWTKSTGRPRSSALVALCEVLVDLEPLE
jgi:hypothetical protein